jgi:type I restriction enzyme S subunit
MSEWTRLSDYCEYMSRGVSPLYTEESGVVVLNQKCVRDGVVSFEQARLTDNNAKPISKDKYLLPYDILVNSTGEGTLGRVAQIKTIGTPVTVDSHVTIVRPDLKKANPAFLGHVLRWRQPVIENLAAGATGQTELSKKRLGSQILVPFFDLPTQTRIADILSAYDNAIENNNRRVALLEKAAQELYREWFVRFRFPGHETAKFVNGLPEGWVVKRLGDNDMINITSSKRIYLSDYVDEGIPFYRSKEIIQLANGDAISESLFIEQEKYEAIKSRFGAPKENDILITSVGTIGVSWLVDKREFYFKDGNLTWLQSGDKLELGQYVFLWLNSDAGKNTLLSSTIGTSQSALTIENLKKIKLIVPSHSLLEEFYKNVAHITKMKRTLSEQSQNLARQRDLLLPRLMSGKLEV